MLTQSITKNSLILGAFALVTAAVLALTHLNTKTKIEEAERRAAQAALLDILPSDTHDNDLLNDTWVIPDNLLVNLGLTTHSKIHIAKEKGLPIAAIIPSIATDGYSGDIKLIVGISHDGTIAGARVLAHKETPGLGDKIDLKKSRWILNFDGKSLSNPSLKHWTVKKDGGEFDQFTGATITPRAVIHQIKTTLQFFENNRTAIFSDSDLKAQTKTSKKQSNL